MTSQHNVTAHPEPRRAVLSVVGGLEFGGWDVAAVLLKPPGVDQLTHSAVAISTWSTVRQGPRGLISSVLYRPLLVSAQSYESTVVPTEAAIPAWTRRSV